MQGSHAHDTRIKGGDKGEPTGRGLSGWSLSGKMKPSNDNGRTPMAGRRASGDRTEIRLGPVQVFVWLGFSLGSIVGAYGLGFVSGKTVGFETARNSSGAEVAKLAVSEVLPDRNDNSPSGIYDRLNAPAVLKQEESPTKGHGAAGAAGKQVRDLTAEKVKEIQAQQGEAAKADDAESSLQQIEDIFAEDGPTAYSPENAKNVRMLGGDTGAAAGATDAAANKTVGSLLDERMNETKTVDNGAALEEKASGKVIGDVAAATTAGAAAATKISKSGPPIEAPSARIAITKKPKAGYYAQVNAPDNAQEAEKFGRKLQESGFPVVIESATSNGKSFYRVLVGPEDNKVQAERLLGQLKGEKYITAKPFIKSFK